MSQEDKPASSKEKSELEPRDARELKKVSDYADQNKENAQNLSENFTNIGSLQLWWDSKVPEKDCWFFRPFNLTSSNRENVLSEIEKYQVFYEELSKVLDKVKNPEKQSDAEKNDPRGTIIDVLKDKLLEMHEAAKLGKETTASSAIYDLHKSFVENHQKLKNMITRVENIALRDGHKKALVGWQSSIQRVNELENTLQRSIEKADETSAKQSKDIDRLMQFSGDLLTQRETLMDANQKMEEGQQTLLQKNLEMEKEREKLRQKNKEMEEEQKKLRKKNEEMQEEQEKLCQKNRKMKDEQEILQQENTVMKNMLKTMTKHEKK